MKTATKRLYEAMFLVDSAKAASDWDGVETNIKNILKRAKAEIVSIKKWDERRLAYPISGHSRGTYILSYFRAEGTIQEIERDVQLSEQIMRVLILCAEGRKKEDIEKDTSAMLAPEEKNEQKAAQTSAETAEAEQEDLKGVEERLETQVSAQAPEPVAADVDGPEQTDEAEIDSEQVDEQSEGEPKVE